MKGQRSRFLRGINWTRWDKDRESESEGSIGLAST